MTAGSTWFGPRPDRFVAIAGSSANQVGSDTSTVGAFSDAFFPAFPNEGANKNADGLTYIREATDFAAFDFERQNPTID